MAHLGISWAFPWAWRYSRYFWGRNRVGGRCQGSRGSLAGRNRTSYLLPPRRTGTRSAAECSWPWKRSFCSSRQDKNGTVSCRGPPATGLLTGLVFGSAPFDLGHAPILDTGTGSGFRAPPVWVDRAARQRARFGHGGVSGPDFFALACVVLTSLRRSRTCPGSCGSGMPVSRCPPCKNRIPLSAQDGHNSAENCTAHLVSKKALIVNTLRMRRGRAYSRSLSAYGRNLVIGRCPCFH